MNIHIRQSFGNCPKYIQQREWAFTPELVTLGQERTVAHATHLTGEQQKTIAQSDTFFIASTSGDQSESRSRGLDVSHRGGKPGFIVVEDAQTLIYPDYLGNFMFNTLGNITQQPKTGLLFLDFTTGTTLQLSGQSAIIWDQERIAAVPGAQRLISSHIEHVIQIEQAVPLSCKFMEYSPALDKIEH